MHQKKLASICLVLLAVTSLAVASLAVAEPDAEPQTAGTKTLPQEGADWPMWSGPEGNLTSLGNGVFDDGAFALERLWTRPLGSAYSGILVAYGRSISAFERESGTLRWSTGDDPVTYQSPMAFDLGGETSLVAVTDRNLLGLAPETGEVLWTH